MSDRFSIHWNRSMSCYRVSVPDVSMHGERVEVVTVEAVERLLRETSKHFAGAHVNAGVVVAQMRRRLQTLTEEEAKRV